MSSQGNHKSKMNGDNARVRLGKLAYVVFMAFSAVWGLLLVALLGTMIVFPRDQRLQNIVGSVWLGMGVPTMAALLVVSSLKPTRQVELGALPLLDQPFKPRKDRSVLWLFGGLWLLVVLAMAAALVNGAAKRGVPVWERPHLLSDLAACAVMMVVLAAIFVLALWQGVVIDREGVMSYFCWNKRRISFHSIQRIEVSRRSTGNGGHTYFLALHHSSGGKSPHNIPIAVLGERDVVAMLRLLRERAPQAEMNELALQVAEGEVPMV